MSDSDDLVLHMRRVQSAERDLRDLGVVWQMIESSAAISCPEAMAGILPTLVRTRERFGDLQQRLIERMVEQSKAALGDELTAKAQCAIDILVRNLYERTADVGFLATDDVVCAYCAAPPDERSGQRAAMVRRLQEYQAKYSVYDNIILLSPTGDVLARLDDVQPLANSRDPLAAQALSSTGYVERFGPSDLAADGQPALLYAHRIQGADQRPVGVLVLRFRFVDEMQRVFTDVDDTRREIALVLVDDDQRVIVSSDDAHVPTGALLRRIEGTEVSLTIFGGREYLSAVCASRGYQGYAGPGWRAQAMVSLLTAFRQVEGGQGDGQHVPLDNAELIAIHSDADAINRDLRRVVWNGRLSAGEQGVEQRADQMRLKAVLSQVATAGMRTRKRVDEAVRDLYGTALGRAQRQTVELARLAADIMDRNLYERANDCRWWALSPAIQRGLAEGADPQAGEALCRVLDHINGLYTVYSRLVAFDSGGVIRGASRAAGVDGLIGHAVDDQWRQKVAALSDSQHYAVSPFEPTTLHDQGATYVYLAAVRDPATRQLLGGVAIVFNAARELKAILDDVIGERTGFAAFIDATGQVLASSHPEFSEAAGTDLAGDDPTIVLEGVHYACARVEAGGYREFKTSDGYDNEVRAVVALRLGAAERRQTSFSDLALSAVPIRDRREAREVAVFQVGASRYALPAGAVLDAIAMRGLVRTPDSSGMAIGLIEVQSPSGPRLVQVACARRLFGVNYPARATDGVIIVLRSPHRPDRPVLGLRVDDVLTVLEVDGSSLHPPPAGVNQFAPWVSGLLDCQAAPSGAHAQRGDAVLVQLLDDRALLSRLLPAALQESHGSEATVLAENA